MKSLIGCLSALVLVASTFAQSELSERQILVIPQAEHPQIAKESGLGGRVTAYVTVDSGGNVISVDNVTGPDWVCPSVARPDVLALREAARIAAVKAKFAPATDAYPTTSIPLNFDFPARKVKVGKGEDKDFMAANASSAKEQAPSASGERYTVKGDSRSTVKTDETKTYDRFGDPSTTASKPPDYEGHVNAVSNGSSGTTPRESTQNVPKQRSGGVLNGKAMSLPKPPYPPAARAVRASGAVNIQVLIDEDGQIFSAVAVSGHPLLRSAAREVACGAAFSPTLLMGNPVKVSGVITYNFVP
ncbi:MAG TPA: energy transducer TonB [Pyrinomonadaceae bacterium]